MPTELVLIALEQALTLRQPAPGLLIHADRGSQYTSLACRQRSRRAHWPATPGRATLRITHRPKPAGAPSKPSCCPTAARSPAWKRPGWKWPTISIRTSTSTAATRHSATARLTSLKPTSSNTYLSSLSVPARPPQVVGRQLGQGLALGEGGQCHLSFKLGRVATAGAFGTHGLD